MNQHLIALELLAPARDLSTGIAAINCGADAVYIGPSGFGARAAAGNSIEDIAALVKYAHPFRVKVYATVNTLLTDEQMPQAVALIHRLYEAGVDAIIIQDAGLLTLALPPVALHASTQFHNYTSEKVRFLENTGISRVILARELSLKEIAAIRAVTSIELESFVHGALCVSLSGQCYLSHALTGRSANRGECSQPCRSYYSLFDGNGQQLAENKHLLSLKDLNLSAHIHQMAEAGITSFKIEGRLKDEGYVKNITAFYSNLINQFIAENTDYKRSSAGISTAGFDPDPERSFNRGFTTYFIEKRQADIHSPDGGKSLGKLVGTVRQVHRDHIVAYLSEPIANGDGLSFFDREGKQRGVRINRAQGNRLFPVTVEGLYEGTHLYRNRDQAFDNLLARSASVRRLPVKAHLTETSTGIRLTFSTLWDVSMAVEQTIEKITANDENKFKQFVTGQISKSGDTIFYVDQVTIGCSPLLIKASILNALRRDGLQSLQEALLTTYQRTARTNMANNIEYPDRTIDFRGNVLNQWARQFYEDRGATIEEAGFESGLSIENKPLMTTRHCLRYSYGACLKEKEHRENMNTDGSWWLTDNHHTYRLQFNCRECLMQVILPGDREIVPLQAKPSTK
ncbi:MAG: hypothetical protein A2X11_14430 [Bacteroidetes bacterium GWE2_42_24]|nr:MAG: hypothetical protein A2X11_14430 [Bacteroidetes bacterium GWE2_42_24]